MTGRTLTHGTQTGYAYHRCRCADCTDAHRLAEAGRRARRAARLAADQDIPHGKPNGYSTFGCRCEPCRQAISEYRRDLRQRRKNGAPIRKLAPRRPAPAPPAPAPLENAEPIRPARVIVPQPIRTNSVYHQLMARHDRMHTRHL